MLNTFGALRTRVIRLMDETTDTSTNTMLLVGEAMNAAHHRVCFSKSWPFLRWPRRETFTTAAQQRVYPLSPQVGKLLDVFGTDQRESLTLMSLRNWEQHGISPENGGGQVALFGGTWPVARQPVAPSLISLLAVADEDVGLFVQLRGITADGHVVDDRLTAAGYIVSSTVPFAFISAVTKIGTWSGPLTLNAAGDVTILTLTAQEYGKQYPTLEFIGQPESNRAFSYAFMRQPRPLVLDNDIPDIPHPHSEILVYETLLDLATYNTDAAYRDVELWKQRRDVMWKALVESQEESIAGSMPRMVRDIDDRGR